jgi:hypothetical protein
MRALVACLWLAASVAVRATPSPQYELADTFIYDNGRVEQLVAMSGDRLTWSAFEGRQYVRDRNFVVPLLDWETVESKGSRRVSSEAGSLWPLEPGKTVRFRVLTDVTVQAKEGANRRRRRSELWSCRVLPAASITVPAGSFAALEIRCEQFSSRTMRILSEERWYYSEEVGHYVSRKWVDLSTGRRGGYSLVARLRGMEANPRRIRSILSKL